MVLLRCSEIDRSFWAMPVPVNGIENEDGLPPSLKLSVPARAPVAVGVNVTSIEQLELAGI